MRYIKNYFLYFFGLLLFFSSVSNVVAAELISSWTNTTALPIPISSNTLVSTNSRIYAFGGANSDIVPLNSHATIQNDGSLSSWIQSGINSPNLFWHSSVVKDNFVYLIGGATHPLVTYSNKVYLGKFSETNTVELWTEVSSMPKPLALLSAVIVGDRLYVSGGFSGSSINQDVYFAIINPDGSLSTWTYAGQINEPRYGHAFLEHNGYFYTIGGRDNSGNFFSQTYRQQADASGNLGLSTPLNELPLGTTRNSTVKIGSKVVVVGGESQIGLTDKIYYADILSDNTFSTWSQSSTPLPGSYCCGAATTAGDYIYYSGGHNGGEYFDHVYYAKVDLSAPPEPVIIDLPVALVKQTSSPWEDDIYDSANIWSSSNPTINRWGCAMTSAVMVLNYHGLTKMANGENVDPGTLNAWLQSQSDGFIGNGLVNWLAISRLSKQISSFNPTFSHDALEYKKIRGMDDETLAADIQENNPGILGVVGHFIVAKGKDADTFLINDPFYNRTKLSDGYNNEYLSLGRYIPSNTDLSYILLVHNTEVDTSLDNSSGQGFGEDFIEEPIIDPVSGIPSGNAQKMKYVPQPATGDYIITVSTTGTNQYNLDIYVYDVNGNVKKFTRTGTVDDETSAIINLHFDKTSLTNSNIPSNEHVVSFSKFYNDIRSLYQQKKIGIITYTVLTVTLKDIENDYKKNRTNQAIKKIDLFIRVIKKLPAREATKPVKDLLLDNLEGLKNYLKP